jgi:serine/threonine protein kinase
MRFLPDAVIEHMRAVADEPDLTGTKYRLVGRLGRGGMGAVYVTEDTELGREVALKVSVPEATSQDVVDRLRREARVIARLEHPGIVPVHDVGVLADGRVYYVMKRVRGSQLDVWLAEKTPSPAAALRLFQRVCDAVAFAHAHDVIHRDLKPENIMVGPFGEALVMDWGLAKDLVDGVAEPGAILGTPGYMAPEQARGEVDCLGPRADVYALGTILDFVIARREAFQSKVPKALASIVRKAMAEDPADRYANAEEMAADVGRYLDGELVGAHRETRLETVGRFVFRHRAWLVLVAAYLLARVIVLLAFRE